jgi:hypothetical protein
MAVGEALQHLGNGGGRHAEQPRPGVVDGDAHLGDVGLLLHQQVLQSRYAGELVAEIIRELAQGGEIMAEDLQHDLAPHPIVRRLDSLGHELGN